MTKLKTLKELNKPRFNPFTESLDVGLDYKELRQEAIKWIKELQSADYNIVTNGKTITEEGFKSYSVEGIIFWIKHFFNITDEELK